MVEEEIKELILIKNKRLFTAITFPESVTKVLERNADLISEYGSFKSNDKDKYHLTMVYIGVTSRVTNVIQGLHASVVEKFKLEFDKVGFFKNQDGLLIWQGIKVSDTLRNLYEDLEEEMSWRGLAKRNREFKPHVTLGRRFVPHEGANLDELNARLEIPEAIDVDRIGLYESSTDEHGMVYKQLDELVLY